MRCAMPWSASRIDWSTPTSAAASSSSVIARPGQGRSGGVRAILVLRRRERAFFLHGFAKSDRENLRRTELKAVRALADEMLRLDEADLDAMLANRAISEVICDD